MMTSGETETITTAVPRRQCPVGGPRIVDEVDMSIEALYERERERLTRRLTRMVGSPALAEDLGQEAFIRTWRRAPEQLGDGERAAWLNRVATNLAIDELRRRRRVPQIDLETIEAPADDHDPDEVASVREALQAVTAHDRMVLLLRFELGLSHQRLRTGPAAATLSGLMAGSRAW